LKIYSLEQSNGLFHDHFCDGRHIYLTCFLGIRRNFTQLGFLPYFSVSYNRMSLGGKKASHNLLFLKVFLKGVST